ncbi:hypothetical protein H5410_054665 [Solanum commersonii]|uniref:Uncharacterized protein n=1 Tax=Solanum commersonii TaxID=4109 RepID=A0A9J5WFJ4_SOLCO|nr:hypothetical protein H5410_054665 [Solanum commersonii]
MAENSKKLHIAVFPWLAFGHMIPYLELSKLIAQKGHKISFISTPRNIDRLPKLPPNLTPFLNFVKLPMPHVEKLPENAEATIDLPYEQVKYLKLAHDALEESMAKFLEDSDIDFILFDFASYWIPSIASKFNIPTGYFSIFIAAVLGFIGPEPGLNNDYEIRMTPVEYTVPQNGFRLKPQLLSSFRSFENLRSFHEGEEENIADIILVGDIHRKPVFPMGQLPTTKYEDDNTKIDAWREMKLWLDEQEKGKVIYVAFGSEAKPSQNELTELSLGLELSGLPFFWVLRTKRGESDDELIQLPEGFEERTKGRGIVCTSWAPQLKILSHDSVGGFLTHSGWSSVVEAIQFEKSLVLLTFLADQGINARLLEEKKMAYSIPRNDQDGSFTSDSVAESLKLYFPWLAFDHMIPYLELSKLIAQKGHKISFISTPRNIDRLPKLPPNLIPFSNFVKLTIRHVKKLPENAEATIDLPYEQVKYLKLAHDALKESVTKFLEDSDIDFILFDFASYWIPSIASKFNIPTGYFSIFIAAVLGFIGPEPGLSNAYEIQKTPEEYTVPPKWVPFETTVAFKLFEGEEENISDIFRIFKAVELSDFLLVRSCSEFESEWLKVVRDIHRKPVFPVGQLPTTTEAKPSQNRYQVKMNSLSYHSGKRNSVHEYWAPQLKILSHHSVGGFLTHSGWSSIVEAIQFEKSLVLLTFLADQGINARLLEEKKMTYSILRDDRDGSFTRDSKVKYLKLAQDGLKKPMAKFLEDSTPDFVIFNFASYLVPSIASKFNIPIMSYFSIFTVAYLVTFKVFEVLRIYEDCKDGLSCSEFEPGWLKVVEDIHQKSVIPVGQLPMTSYEDDNTKIDVWREIKLWLDKQEKEK